MNIASIVVRTLPENLESVENSLKECGLCEVHFKDESGRIIVTIEAENLEKEIKILQQIQIVPLVLSADMMYSYSEEELEAQIAELSQSQPVPEVLEKDLPAGMIRYNGAVGTHLDRLGSEEE